MHITLAANTRSGGSTDPERIAAELRRHGPRVQVLALQDLDTAGAVGSAQRLVVAGGDGSLGTAARAAHHAGIPLAVVPTGTANDFARALGLPADLERACALAADADARTRHQEIGMVGEHPFVNAAAAGLSAAASLHAEPHKSRLGPLAYAVGALKAGLTAPTLRCSVRCDGRDCFTGDVWQVVVGVTGAFGGGSQIGGTDSDDSTLDVAVVPAGPRRSLVRRAYGMRRGRLTAQRDVEHLRGWEVEIRLPPGNPFNVDGDVRECDPARFSLLPGGVQVVVP